MTQQLKTCPFCGCDKIEIFHDHPNAVGALHGYYIHHPLWTTYPNVWQCWLNFGGKFETEEAAASAWNDRVCESESVESMTTVSWKTVAVLTMLYLVYQAVRPIFVDLCNAGFGGCN